MLSLTSRTMGDSGMRKAINTLRIAAVALLVAAMYRNRRGIRRSLSGGFGSVRRTASNLNDLLFSSSSLASAFAKDLRTFLYTDSGHTPKSLHRLIGLLCSDEVQKSIHGTSQTLLAAFFAARRKEAEERKLKGEDADDESLSKFSDALITKLFSPAGHHFIESIMKSASSSFLSIYLSLPAQAQVAQPASHPPATVCELTGTILDKLSTPQGRQLVVAAVGAFTNAAAPIVISGIHNGNNAVNTESTRRPEIEQTSMVQVVLEWLTHPSSREQAEKLLTSVSSKTVSAAVVAAMQCNASAEASKRASQQGASAIDSVDGRDDACMMSRPRTHKVQSPIGMSRDEHSVSHSRRNSVSSIEGEQNPPRQTPQRTSNVLGGGECGVGSIASVELFVALAERPACRVLICEVAGACVREGVLAIMCGMNGGSGVHDSHVLLRGSWESVVLLAALALMAGLAQGAALSLCAWVLAGWCLALLVRGTRREETPIKSCVGSPAKELEGRRGALIEQQQQLHKGAGVVQGEKDVYEAGEGSETRSKQILTR